MKTLAEQAAQGLSWGGNEPTPEQIAHVLSRLTNVNHNANGMAWTMGRNLAIKNWRKRRAEARAVVARQKAAMVQARDKVQAEIDAATHAEFMTALPGLLARFPAHALKLEALRLCEFENVRIAELATRHGISRANADQRLKRAREIVKGESISEDLRARLTRR